MTNLPSAAVVFAAAASVSPVPEPAAPAAPAPAAPALACFPDFAAFSTRYDTAMRGGELQAPNPYANALPNEQEELTTADGGLAEAPRTEQGALQNLEPWVLRLFYQLQAALPFVMLQIGGWGGVFNSPGMLSRS